MSQKHDNLHLGKYNLNDLVETPGGLLVSSRSIEPLIKSEARRLAAEQGNTPSFFSKHQLFQNMMYYGARAKPQGTPNFASLYEAANTSFIDRILVRARSNRYKQIWQKAVTGKSVGFRVVHEQYDDPKWRPTDDIIRRCKEMEALIGMPTPEEYTRFYPMGVVPHESGIKDMVSRLVRAELIIDRKVIYRGRRRDGKGYAFFHWVPGQSVYPVHEALKRYEEKQRKAGDKTKMGFDQLINRASASYGIDLTDKDYIQIDKAGEVCGSFTADEISIHIANPSDEMDRFGFGECLPWDTVIETDQGKIRIGEIVRKKLAVNVKSYNRETGEIEYQPVLNWFKRANKEPLVKLSWGSGQRGNIIRCTPNHPILTPTGYVPAKDMKTGDWVMVEGPVLSSEQEQVAIGTLLGDGHLKKRKNMYGNPAISITHGDKQRDYIEWKAEALKTLKTTLYRSNATSRVGKVHGRTHMFTEHHETLAPIASLVTNKEGRKYVTQAWLDRIDVLGLAVWAMDNGTCGYGKYKMADGTVEYRYPRFTFCTQGFTREECDLISKWLDVRWGIHSTVQCPPSSNQCRIRLSPTSTQIFFNIVAPYFGMDEERKKVWKFPEIEQGKENGAAPVRLITVEQVKAKPSVYDLEINQNHNFVVNGLVVHNSSLEISLDITAMILDAWQYNRELFNSDYPEAFLEVVGEYDKQGLEAFKMQMAAGKGQNKRLPVIASSGEQSQGAEAMKFNVHKLRDNPKDMQFDNLFRMMCNIKCAAYGDHPSVINFIMDGGSGGSSLFGHSPKDEIENSKEHGFLPSLLDMASWLTRAIIKPQYDDLKLIIEGFDQGDEKQRQDIFLNKLKTYVTRNEARMSDGMEPDGFWLAKEDLDKLSPEDEKYQSYWGNPMNYPSDAAVPNYITALASKKQMESMAQQPGEDGEEGEDDQGDQEQMAPEDDGSPWAAAGDQNIPMQKSRPEVKYLKISIEE